MPTVAEYHNSGRVVLAPGGEQSFAAPQEVFFATFKEDIRST